VCGIYGALSSDPARPIEGDLLERMGRALVHRGPDGGGSRIAGPIGIGMRRLSIIDLAGGDQPMANEDGTIWIVFNGEIYNYRALAADLRMRGHRFATASDTEVILHLYEEHGERCVEQLRGMFAFAIWEEKRRTLFLARDRFGIKPLYYAVTPQGFLFASELKALLQSPWLPRRLDNDAVLAYLQYGYVPDPQSILQDVAKLPSGHTLLVEDGRLREVKRYWQATSFFLEGRPVPSEEEAAERLWTGLEDAVRSHMVSDVPVGAFLSGGLDSSAVVSIMARASSLPIKTFSVGFREDRYNELPYARQAAEWCGTEHHELMVEPNDLKVLDEILAGFDEPFADSSAIPTYLVSRLAREHVKVVLSGDGGDELFAGYERYQVDYGRRRLGILGDLHLGGPLRALSAVLPVGGGKNTLHNLSLPRLRRYLDTLSLFPDGPLRELIGPARAIPPSLLEAMVNPELDPLSRLQDLDLKSYLPGDILTKVDRMSMANSLEARVPLLDHHLAEYACGLPPAMRMRGPVKKYLLKRALRDRIPADLLTRPKQGFGVPLESWFSGSIRSFFHDRLGDGSRLAAIGIRPQGVRALQERFEQTRRRDYCDRLWALVVLDHSVQRLFGATA
jgi:asparagine synthase (glutamine-hydrolysing)